MHRPFRLKKCYIAWLAALASLSHAAPAWADDAAAVNQDRPHIDDCRVGFNGVFKVGYWTPLWVTVSGDAAGQTIEIEVATADSDGVETTISTGVPATDEPPGRTRRVLLYARMGRIGSPIRVALIADGSVVDRREVLPGRTLNATRPATSLTATGELIVQIGAAPTGVAEALPDRDSSESGPARRFVVIDAFDDLPTEWFGFESVDALVLPAGDGAIARQLAADAKRFAAVADWVELGGRLILLCGGRTAQDMIADGRPLAPFAPGRFIELGRLPLPQMGALEHFSESNVPIDAAGPGRELSVPLFSSVVGRIDVHGGVRPGDVPLVVRSPRGLGEIMFAALDIDQPPLSDWAGRPALLRALLRPLLPREEAADVSRSLITSGYDDLSGALRERLGQSFAQVRPITFNLVAALAVLYLLTLFPLNYLLVHMVFRRPAAAWLTLPLTMIAFAAAAIGLGATRSASVLPSLNQVELVDIDLASGRTRGTYWACIYSPHASRFDAALDGRQTSPGPEMAADVRLSWHGLPGSGVGGMNAGGAELNIVPASYRFVEQGDQVALEGVPILNAATKSLTARWTAPAQALLSAELSDEGGRGSIAGELVNVSEIRFEDVRLLYGNRAFRLGALDPGQRKLIDGQLRAIGISTLITGRAQTARDEGRFALQIERASTAELLDVMMFFAAAGGVDFARLPFRYQADSDLSRQLELGRAVLVAVAPAAGSRLVAGPGGAPLGDEANNTRFTVYRFVLPVDRGYQ
jgi:hypothetical protein